MQDDGPAPPFSCSFKALTIARPIPGCAVSLTTPAIIGKIMLWIALWLLGVSSAILGPLSPSGNVPVAVSYIFSRRVVMMVSDTCP